MLGFEFEFLKNHWFNFWNYLKIKKLSILVVSKKLEEVRISMKKLAKKLAVF
jgi:hypothetical protein